VAAVTCPCSITIRERRAIGRDGGTLPLSPRYEPEMTEVITRFIAHRVELAQARGVVIGISGGLDSAVVAALCVRALGNEKVLGLMMPEKRPSPEAVLAVEWLGIGCRVEPIEKLVADAVDAGPAGLSKECAGNIKARLRMLLLYAEANQNGRLVVGTGNKSELLTGYFTKFGDGGADMLPIGDLYKTQVRQLAEDLGVPERIRRLAPTAGLYPGQTDEAELGISYERLDKILLGLELRLEPPQIARKAGVPVSEVGRISGRVQATVHKRILPAIPKLGIRTIGLDWREEMAPQE
jgi:NAD+ synthase